MSTTVYPPVAEALAALFVGTSYWWAGYSRNRGPRTSRGWFVHIGPPALTKTLALSDNEVTLNVPFVVLQIVGVLINLAGAVIDLIAPAPVTLLAGYAGIVLPLVAFVLAEVISGMVIFIGWLRS